MRDAMDEAIEAHHIATAKAAGLGRMLANDLHNGWPVEMLTFLIDQTIAANAEVETTFKAIVDVGDRSRAAFYCRRPSVGVGR